MGPAALDEPLHSRPNLAGVPKLAPDAIHRERLTAWLADHAEFPVRLLVAPTGSGKTTALVHYAGRSRYRAAYARMTCDTQPAGLLAALAVELGLPPVADAGAFLTALNDLGRTEVLVDEAETASPACLDVLRRLVMEAPVHVTFVYASRTRDILDTTRLVSLGLAALMNADRLAFTVQEAARFVEAAKALVEDENDIARLINDTEGWAFALCSAVRDAASCGRTLSGCFERWKGGNARFIKAFLDAALSGEAPAVAQAARASLDGGQIDGDMQELLESRGLFVRWSDGRYRPYRAISRVAAEPFGGASLSPITARLFGAFDLSIDGQSVEWIRRRDGQIFAYIALQPHGRASRSQIVEAFWPDAHPQLAGQSLRSACSTMRRALAKLVGYGALPHYVSFGDQIALNLDLFAIDARRVASHLDDASSAVVRGDGAVAAGHAAAALRLAREPFLNDAVPSPLDGVAEKLYRRLTDAQELVDAHDAPILKAG